MLDGGNQLAGLYGYNKKQLRIDLTRGKAIVEGIDRAILKRYVGGKGLGAKMFSEYSDLSKDVWDPSNPLIIATGPVNGLVFSGAAKFCAVFRSPLTEVWGESQCGGYFGPELKRAGYDAVIIGGKSEKPVYLLIEGEKVELRKAGFLWGKDTFETEDIIKENYGSNFQVLSIGPAGENLVKFACVSHDKGRELGRCGAGAVMGSKKLKAIAVRGTGRSSVAEPEKLKEFTRELNSRVKDRLKSLMDYGTPNMISIVNATGSLPTRNWTGGEFKNAEKIGAEAIKKNIMKKSKACFACAVACRKISTVESGPYAGTEVEGPEYETLYAFGPLCGNDNLESIAKANEICDRLGMDTISAGNVLAFAMECIEKGSIKDIRTREELKSLKLHFGNHEAMVSMLPRIAYRNGLGNILAGGVRYASKIIGGDSARFAVHVKGLEPAGYDPRALKGMALAYAVSCRGACHLRHMTHRPNLTGAHPIFGRKIDRLLYEGQPELVAEQEDFYSLVDSMVLCKFLCLPAVGPIQWGEIVDLYNIVTGLKVEKKQLAQRARDITNVVRKLNNFMGVGRKQDHLPARFFEESLKNGSSQGQKVDRNEFEKMLSKYYRLKGWSMEGISQSDIKT